MRNVHLAGRLTSGFGLRPQRLTERPGASFHMIGGGSALSDLDQSNPPDKNSIPGVLTSVSTVTCVPQYFSLQRIYTFGVIIYIKAVRESPSRPVDSGRFRCVSPTPKSLTDAS